MDEKILEDFAWPILLFHKPPPAGADKLANVVNMAGNVKQMPALELEAFLEGEGSSSCAVSGQQFTAYQRNS